MPFEIPGDRLLRHHLVAALIPLTLAVTACSDKASREIQVADATDAAPHVRLAASLALEDGSDASMTVLRALISDPDWMVRAQAATILGRAGEDAVEILGPATADAEVPVRVAALNSLHSISGSLTVPWLVAALDDSDARVRIRSLRALADVGLLGASEATRVVELLGDPNPRARRWASIVAVEIGSSAVTPLVSALEQDPDRRWRAAWALGEIGPRAASALPRLRELAAGDDERVAGYARAAIPLIEPEG